MEEKYLYSGSEFARPVDDLSFHNSKTSLDYNYTKQMYNEFYRPNNMCISIVSKIPFLTIKHMISSSYFIRKMAIPSSNRIQIPSYKLNPQSKIEYSIGQKKVLMQPIYQSLFERVLITIPINIVFYYYRILLVVL